MRWVRTLKPSDSLLGGRSRMAGAPTENKYQQPQSCKQENSIPLNRLMSTNRALVSFTLVSRTTVLGEWLRRTAARFRLGCFGMKAGVPARFLEEMGSREGCLPAIMYHIRNLITEQSNESAQCHKWEMRHALADPQTTQDPKIRGSEYYPIYEDVWRHA